MMDCQLLRSAECSFPPQLKMIIESVSQAVHRSSKQACIRLIRNAIKIGARWGREVNYGGEGGGSAR